jgi:hypothetical protein
MASSKGRKNEDSWLAVSKAGRAALGRCRLDFNLHPGGMHENNPMLQQWVDVYISLNPQGTAAYE